jgi:hypothetical protein
MSFNWKESEPSMTKPTVEEKDDKRKKDCLIGKLIGLGVYKMKGHQLYQLSVNELETTYRQQLQSR